MNLINELRELAEDLHVNGYNRYSSAMSQAADELDALRAKVEQMEKQEPLITVLREPDYWSNGHFHKGTKPYISLKQLSKLKIGDNLYTLPGAQTQGEEK